MYSLFNCISNIVWFRVQFGKKTCTSEFFKDDQKTDECMFFQITRENIILLINNIHEKMIKNRMFRRHLRSAFFLSLYPPCI